MVQQQDTSDNAQQRVRLTRLVQHVALNKSGWWDWALERLTLACAYMLGSSTLEQLCQLVNTTSGIQVTSSRLHSTIDKLLHNGSLVAMGNQLHIAEALNTDLRKYEAQTTADEQETYHQFETLARKHGLGEQAPEFWTVLQDDVVLPLIDHLGARTYQFLHPSSLEDTTTINSYIDELVTRYGKDVRVLFATFLDPHNPHVRRFVLRRLNAQYALSAAALPPDDLDKLAQLNTKPNRVDVFLDTNFLLSVLGLHDNPSDSVAIHLLTLVDELRTRVNLKLYVLPITIEETRNAIRNVTFSLSGFRGQRNLADAGRRITSNGLVRRYLEAAYQSATLLTPEDFFEPYDTGLIPLLRSRTIELYNTNLDALRTSPEVIDDIHIQEDFQERYRYRGPKPYPANLHDMVLWHFANNRRGTPSLPLEIPSWVVTIDFGLLKFDRYKGYQSSVMPVCLHPAMLIDMFQFWVPSSTTLDEALVGSIRHPLMFLDFDIVAEKVTLRILAQISRYGNAEDISTEAAASILTNNALRERITKAAPDHSQDTEIVEAYLPEVVRTFGDTVQSLRDQIADAQSNEDELRELKKIVAEERTRHLETRKALEQEREARQGEAERAASERTTILPRLEELEEANLQLRQDGIAAEQRRSENRSIAIRSSIVVTFSLATLACGLRFLPRLLSDRASSFVAVCTTIVVVLFGTHKTFDKTRYDALWILDKIPKLLRHWWAGIGAVLIIVIGGWLLNELKL